MVKRSLSNQEKDLLTYALEAPLTDKAKKWLDLQPDIHWYKASDRYTPGVSDLIICVGGIFVAAELKSATGVASLQQLDFIERVIRSGGIAGVCDNMAALKALVRKARAKLEGYNE